MEIEKEFTPWSKKQVEALKRRQAKNYMQPYTCDCGRKLVPTKEGWRCPKCQYVQWWAFADDAGPK